METKGNKQDNNYTNAYLKYFQVAQVNLFLVSQEDPRLRRRFRPRHASSLRTA